MALALLVVQGSATGSAEPADGGTEPAGREGSDQRRSSQAVEVELALGETAVVKKLEAALGDAFGGVWFEAETARLHVGVTSDRSRRNAEAVAAQAGLAEEVRETPVRSTWVELNAAQERWNDRLGELFDRGEASTSLIPERNSVEIALGSEVPSWRRAELERETGLDAVKAFFSELPTPRLSIVPTLQCEKHKQFMAYCDPPLVSGVSIDNEAAEKGQGDCTAGPLAINRNPTTKAEATETFLLTAGHCIVGEGAVTKNWHAFEKAGEKTRKAVGKAADALQSTIPGTGYDVGVINLTAAPWIDLTKANPINPTVARWSAAGESTPMPVTKQLPAVVGTQICYSGQRSGTQCGQIEKIQTYKVEEKEGVPVVKREWKDLIQVKLEGGKKIGKGDSGSPMFLKAPYEKGEAHIQGIQVAATLTPKEPEESNTAYFQGMADLFAALKKEKNRDLRLLTNLNANRHGPQIKGDKYPVTFSGGTTGVEKFTTEFGSVECKESTYHAVLSEASSTLTVTPTYDECEVYYGDPVSIDMEGCVYVYHVLEEESADNFSADMDIECPEGKSILVDAGLCAFRIEPQDELQTVDLINDTSATPSKDITVRPTISELVYAPVKDECGCFSDMSIKSNGTYTNTANITITGENPSEPAEEIDIEVDEE